MACNLTDEEVAFLDQTIDGLKAENAKLRELVRLMWFLLSRFEMVTSWRFEGDGKVMDSAYFADRMRELGAEVGE